MDRTIAKAGMAFAVFYLPIFAELLDDTNERVRIEAPEMFRVDE